MLTTWCWPAGRGLGGAGAVGWLGGVVRAGGGLGEEAASRPPPAPLTSAQPERPRPSAQNPHVGALLPSTRPPDHSTNNEFQIYLFI